MAEPSLKITSTGVDSRLIWRPDGTHVGQALKLANGRWAAIQHEGPEACRNRHQLCERERCLQVLQNVGGEVMNECSIRTHKECSCDANECRAIHLGTFVKERKAVQETFLWHHLVILVAISVSITAASYKTMEYQDSINARTEQEARVKW